MFDLNTTLIKIEAIAIQLESLGNRLVVVSKQMGNLKQETFEHQETQKEDIRKKEQTGYLQLSNGEKVKLTDSMRESLSSFGKLKKCAEYEGLKREKDGLDSAVKALTTAQTGYQTIARVLEAELTNLGRQP